MILLDSSVIIEMFRKKDKQQCFFYQLSQTNEDFAISAITHYEIFCGSDASQDLYWKDFLRIIPVLPFDTGSSKEAVSIYKELKRSNKMIDLADLLIAATAKSHKIPLATINIKHFSRVKGLKLLKNN